MTPEQKQARMVAETARMAHEPLMEESYKRAYLAAERKRLGLPELTVTEAQIEAAPLTPATGEDKGVAL